MADVYQVTDGKAVPIIKDGVPSQIVDRVNALETRMTALEAGGGSGGGPALSDAVDSENSDVAASSRAVKTAYDMAALLEDCVALGDVQGTLSLDPLAGRVFAAHAVGALTVCVAADSPGASLLLVLSGGDTHTVTWDMAPQWSGGTAPVLSAKDLIALTCAPGGAWLGVLVSGNVQ